VKTSFSKLLALVPLGALNLLAQGIVWDANATTAVPNFQANGVVKTTTVDTTVHGRGLRPRQSQEGYGLSYAYVPVTAPQGTTFACIGLRAADNSTSGAIRAEFYRQPRNGNPGAAVFIGGVGTIDAGGDGFQFRQGPFAAHVINYVLNTYYVRLTFSYQGASTFLVPSPIAFDVSLSSYCSTAGGV
jgi:hypothetical protein